MAKSNFNLAELIGSAVSDLNTAAPREQIEYVDIDLIDADPNNFYELSGIDELAANIELFGVQQPIRVRANPEAPGRVIIVSGHRRRAAVRKLVEAGRDDLRELPCIRERAEGSAALQELRLIYANSDTRQLTSAEISKQAERVEILLYQLKEEGYEFPGRMRDHVAEACKVSATKLARLKVIRENLSPDFLPAFEKNTLSEQTAYALARLPLDFQHRVFRVVPPAGLKGNSAERIQRMYESGVRWEPQMACPDGKPCTHGDAAMRHDIDSYDVCKAERCCLTCDQSTRNWSPCEKMCSKAKAQRKAEKDEREAKEAKKQQKRTNAAQKKTQANAQRLLRAIDASGVSDKMQIYWEYGYITVGDIRKYAAGDFDGTGTWYSEMLAPTQLQHPLEVAKKLGCSADFLLGLTDELKPAAAPPAEGWVPLQWRPGPERPTKDGQRAAAKFMAPGMIRPNLTIAYWHIDHWCFLVGSTIDAECVGWFPLPED